MNSRIAILPNATLDAFKPTNDHDSEQKTSSSHENASSLSFLTLPHPRTGHAALFLPFRQDDLEHEKYQILEVQAVDPPASRSWFIDDDTILEDGRLILMTPMDPAFLLIAILRSVTSKDGAINFRTAEDIFNLAATKLSEQSQDAKSTEPPTASVSETDILHLSTLDFIPSTLSRICETKDLDASMIVYRFSLPKTLELLRLKASRLATEELATRIRPFTRSLAVDGLGSNESVDDSLREAGRLKLACDVLAQYLPSDIHEALVASYDFAALNKYVRSIRAEAAPSKPVTKSSSSSKATATSAKGAEGSKKRKAETQASRGQQKLLKTDTSKMAKLTTFFAKKPS